MRVLTFYGGPIRPSVASNSFSDLLILTNVLIGWGPYCAKPTRVTYRSSLRTKKFAHCGRDSFGTSDVPATCGRGSWGYLLLNGLQQARFWRSSPCGKPSIVGWFQTRYSTFVRAFQSRVPCHLGGGAALAGAYLGHRLTGDVDLFNHSREGMRGLVGLLSDVAAEAGVSLTVLREESKAQGSSSTSSSCPGSTSTRCCAWPTLTS